MKGIRRWMLGRLGLPVGYERCEYIKNAIYKQRICLNTGITNYPNHLFYECKFGVAEEQYDWDTLFCCQTSWGNNANSIYISNKDILWDHPYRTTIRHKITIGNTYTLKTVIGDGMYLDGVKLATDNYCTSNEKTDVYMFGDYNGSNTMDMPIYYAKIYSTDNGLERDFIPVYKKDTEEYGLWDKIGRKFYGSANGNKFTGNLLGGGGGIHKYLIISKLCSCRNFRKERRAAA